MVLIKIRKQACLIVATSISPSTTLYWTRDVYGSDMDRRWLIVSKKKLLFHYIMHIVSPCPNDQGRSRAFAVGKRLLFRKMGKLIFMLCMWDIVCRKEAPTCKSKGTTAALRRTTVLHKYHNSITFFTVSSSLLLVLFFLCFGYCFWVAQF